MATTSSDATRTPEPAGNATPYDDPEPVAALDAGDGTGRPFRLGFLTHVFGHEEPRELYRRLVELFVVADELGYDGGWVAQHHFQSEYGRLPSPLVLLAAAAQATRHLDLGTAVVVLPLEDPIRLAEDAAVVDAISGGRLQLALGTGGPSTPVFGAFGKDAQRRRELFAESLSRLRALLGGEPISGTDGLRVQPPGTTLTSRLWDSTSVADGARRAAKEGDGLLLGVGPAATAQRPLAEAYLAAHEGPAPARLAVAHGVFPGPDRHAAARDLAADIARYRSLLSRFGLPADADDLTTLDAMNVHHGPVESVIESLSLNPVGPGFVSTFIAAVQGEDGPAADFDATVARLEVIATRVALELGWRPVSRTPSAAGAGR